MRKMLTPSDLQMKSNPVNVSGKYDWKKQTYQYDACKFGTYASTTNGTRSGQFNFQDDNTTDSIND